MYYSDHEIYTSIKQGVAAEILAELNGCSIDQINKAYNRCHECIEKKDREYNMVLSHMPNNPYRRSYTSMKEINTKRKYVKYNYSEQENDKIAQMLSQGLTTTDIYNTLYGNLCEEDRPGIKAFYAKCSKLKKEIDNESNKIVETIENHSEPEYDGSNVKLTQIRAELDSLLSHLAIQYQTSVHEIMELNNKIDMLTK